MFIVNFEKSFIHCSVVPIVDFEQVNASWDGLISRRKNFSEHNLPATFEHSKIFFLRTCGTAFTSF